jgi:transcription elongation factor GreB
MSKAFRSESDDAPESDEPVVSADLLGKNYMTPAGAKRMQDEFRELRYKTRLDVTRAVSAAAANGDRSENADYHYAKRKLREIDKRLGYLSKRLENLEVIDPLAQSGEEVRFGATVDTEDEDGNRRTYSIVGVDELDLSKGRVSWKSPIGSALMRAKAGDFVTFQAPAGERTLEIIAVRWVKLD